MHRLRILHIKMNYVWMNKQRYWIRGMYTKVAITGKSLSEALLFAEHGENMLCTKIVLNVRNNFWRQHVLPRFELGIFIYWTCNSMNNLLSYYGLVDAKIRASDKDLPVQYILRLFLMRYLLRWMFVQHYIQNKNKLEIWSNLTHFGCPR